MCLYYVPESNYVSLISILIVDSWWFLFLGGFVWRWGWYWVGWWETGRGRLGVFFKTFTLLCGSWFCWVNFILHYIFWGFSVFLYYDYVTLFYTIIAVMLLLFYVIIYSRKKYKKTHQKTPQNFKIQKKNACLFSTNVDLMVNNMWYGLSICTRFSHQLCNRWVLIDVSMKLLKLQTCAYQALLQLVVSFMQIILVTVLYANWVLLNTILKLLEGTCWWLCHCHWLDMVDVAPLLFAIWSGE